MVACGVRTTLLAALIALSFAASARADVPPPPGYVESCTAATQQQAEEVCVDCNTFHGEPTRCRDTLGTTGHTQRCRTSGASVWTEVWCRARTEADGPATPPPAATSAAPAPSANASTAPATPQPAASSSSCAIAASSRASALPALALALALLLTRRGRAR